MVELRSSENQLQAAIVAEAAESAKAVTEPTEDSETRERREYRGKARVSDHLAAAAGRPSSPTGASGNTPTQSGSPGSCPWSFWRARSPRFGLVTPGPLTTTVSATRPTVPYAFARTDASCARYRNADGECWRAAQPER